MLILRGHRNWLVGVAYAPQGGMLASGDKDGVVKLWDLTAGKERATLQAMGTRPRLLRALAFSRDGQLLAAGGYSHALAVWEVATGQQRTSLRASGWMLNLTFAPNHRTLAVAWTDGGRHNALALFDLEAEQPQPWPLERPGRSVIEAVAFTPDGSGLVGGGREAFTPQARGQGVIHLWDSSTRERRWGHTTEPCVRAVAFTPNGRILVAAVGRMIELRDAASGKRQDVLSGHTKLINTLSISPDGRWLLSGGNDARVRLWNLATGRERAVYDWGVGEVRSVAFAPDGMTAAVGGDRRKVVVWDVDEAAC